MSTENDSTPNWDARFSKEEYAYGEEPNEYFKEELEKLSPGKILLPADGEGRNGVFAAKKGWNVTAFDQSVKGKEKAEKLAKAQGVSLKYDICDMGDASYPENEFDAIGFVYVHFPMDKKKSYYQRLFPSLKSGGYVIAEIFSDKHLPYREKNPNVGGPKNFEYLFSKKELEDIFSDFNIISLEEKVVELKEGPFHDGMGSVFRLLAKKK